MSNPIQRRENTTILTINSGLVPLDAERYPRNRHHEFRSSRARLLRPLYSLHDDGLHPLFPTI